MKLKRARELVQSKQIIYPEHVTVIERKIKILRKRAEKISNKDTAKSFIDKALEWESLLKANFWHLKGD